MRSLTWCHLLRTSLTVTQSHTHTRTHARTHASTHTHSQAHVYIEGDTCSLGDVGYYFWYAKFFRWSFFFFLGKQKKRKEWGEKKTTEGRHEKEEDCVWAADGWRGEGDSPPGPGLDSRRNLTRVPASCPFPSFGFRGSRCSARSPLWNPISSLPPKGRSKGRKKEKWIPHLPALLFSPFTSFFHTSLLSLSLSLSWAKRLVFPEKETSFNGGTREKKEEKKIIQLFCVFLPNGSCLSHCFPHSHHYTPRAVAVSKSTAEYHMGQPHSPPPPSTVLPSHTPCPPGCLSSGLFGINELIHTALSGSIPFAARAQCKQAYGSKFIGHSSEECAWIRSASKVLIPGYTMRSV